MNRIEEIRARCDAATPWSRDSEGWVIMQNNETRENKVLNNFDFRFVAHAREDIPFLLDELAAKDVEIERLTIEKDAALKEIPISCAACKYIKSFPCSGCYLDGHITYAKFGRLEGEQDG